MWPKSHSVPQGNFQIYSAHDDERPLEFGVNRIAVKGAVMEYEAPKLVEVGSVEDLTLGMLRPGPAKDNTIWWDWFGDPASR